ncbi:MAG TPA: helix-turn-helix domain-containing protein [Pseudomonadales bacterium]
MSRVDDQPSLRERKKRQARQQILAAAQRLIRSRGYQATTMREIAAAAELSYQTLYNYFPTKADILRTLLSEQVADLTRRYEALLAAWEGTLPDALDALNTLSFAAIADGDRALWRIATLEFLQQSNATVRMFRMIDEMAHEMLKRLLVLARNRGELANDVHLPTLGNVLFDLADYALLRFILDPALTLEAALSALGDEVRLVLSPHLSNTTEYPSS